MEEGGKCGIADSDEKIVEVVMVVVEVVMGVVVVKGVVGEQEKEEAGKRGWMPSPAGGIGYFFFFMFFFFFFFFFPPFVRGQGKGKDVVQEKYRVGYT